MPDMLMTEEQRDALQEIANLAMGRAAARLAPLFGRFVELSVPRVRIVRVSEAGDALRDMTGIEDNVTAIRQGFRSDIKGEALVLCRTAGVRDLVSLVDGHYGSEGYEASLSELVFDVANVLIGACVSSILGELGRTPVYSPPGLLGTNVPLDDVFQPAVVAWSVALLLEVNLGPEDDTFRAHFAMLMAEDSVRQVSDALDALLSSL